MTITVARQWLDHFGTTAPSIYTPYEAGQGMLRQEGHRHLRVRRPAIHALIAVILAHCYASMPRTEGAANTCLYVIYMMIRKTRKKINYRGGTEGVMANGYDRRKCEFKESKEEGDKSFERKDKNAPYSP